MNRRSVLAAVGMAFGLTGCTARSDQSGDETTMEFDNYETTMGSNDADEFNARISALCDLAISNGVPREVVIGRLLTNARDVEEMDDEWASILEDSRPVQAIPTEWWTRGGLYEDLTGPYIPEKHDPPEDPEIKARADAYFEEKHGERSNQSEKRE